jgi:hypothetical protein
MHNVPDGAARYGRRRQSARMAGLALYCAALALALGVVAVAVLLHSIPHVPQTLPLPSPGASPAYHVNTCSPTCTFRLRSAGKIPGVDVALILIAGFGSLLAGIGATACGTVAVGKLGRRNLSRTESET